MEFTKEKTPEWLLQIIGSKAFWVVNDLRFFPDTLDEEELECIKRQMMRVNIHNILENSCFYYCADRDITPIVALDGCIHSFIYCDSNLLQYNESLSTLKERLRIRGHQEIQSINIDTEYFEHRGLYLRIPKNIPIQKPTLNGNFSIWENSGQLYSLLYFCWDAICVWENLYKRFSIYPIVVCDINSRGSNMHNVWNINNIPKYIIGNIDKFKRFFYKEIGKVEYFGDCAPCSTLWKISNFNNLEKKRPINFREKIKVLIEKWKNNKRK